MEKSNKVWRVSDSSQAAGWESWDRGWGWTLKLANGLQCTVSKSMTRGEGFEWCVFGLRGKKKFEDENKAKRVAETLARKLLEEAISNLPNAHALAEERSDDSQKRVVGGKVDQ